jgi:hypothetical protein
MIIHFIQILFKIKETDNTVFFDAIKTCVAFRLLLHII